jgi:hypothetical protein
MNRAMLRHGTIHLFSDCPQTDLDGTCLLHLILSFNGAGSTYGFLIVPWAGSEGPAAGYSRFKTAVS